MRVFITGATGFIGSAVVAELLSVGHQVVGLTRSDAGAESLAQAGAEVHRGSLQDSASLQIGAAEADAVIHCGFSSDVPDFVANCKLDEAAINVLGDALAGTNKALLVTSGIGPWAPGRAVTEDDHPPANSPMPRVSEQTGLAQAAKGVRSAVIRMPQVHDTRKQGLVSMLVAGARVKGLSGYAGEGLNRWCAAHVLDVAVLYRLALENIEVGARYHAVSEEGVELKAIAETIGRRLGVQAGPVASDHIPAHFGFAAPFIGLNLLASSQITQQRLGWTPKGPGLLEDLERLSQ